MTVRESDPERVQIEGVVDAKVMARPDVEVSVKGRVKEPEPNARSESAPNVIVWLAAFTVMVNELVVAVAELLSVTRMERELLPALLGVPEMTPVEGAKVRPVGSDPEKVLKVLVPLPPDVVSESV